MLTPVNYCLASCCWLSCRQFSCHNTWQVTTRVMETVPLKLALGYTYSAFLLERALSMCVPSLPAYLRKWLTLTTPLNRDTAVSSYVTIIPDEFVLLDRFRSCFPPDSPTFSALAWLDASSLYTATLKMEADKWHQGTNGTLKYVSLPMDTKTNRCLWPKACRGKVQIALPSLQRIKWFFSRKFSDEFNNRVIKKTWPCSVLL